MYLGVDIGGTNIRMAVCEKLILPKILKSQSIPNSHIFNDYINQIFKFADEFEKIDGIGVSINSDLNLEKTTVIDASYNSPELQGKNFVEIFSKYKCPIKLANDAVAEACGEKKYSSREQDFIYLIWGSGLGGSYVSSTNPEIKQLDWDTYFEIWESQCGGKAIERNYGKPAMELSSTEWQDVFNQFSQHLFSFVQHFKSLPLVFSGGIGINKSGELLKFIMSSSLNESISPLVISPTILGELSGIYGAFAIQET